MNIFHIAKIYPKGHIQYIFLKKEDDQFYWEGLDYKEDNYNSALKIGAEHWKDDYFQLVNCGFRYSLPIRDEVGMNALFWQMAKSYKSSNGVYFDEDVGHECIVKFASDEALGIWKKIS